MKTKPIFDAIPGRSLLRLLLVLAPLITGCAAIPQSGIATFSAGISSAKTQADTAFRAVTDLTSQSIIDYAAAQPTLTDSNFLPVLDAKSIAVWDQVFGALQKYSESLTLLTSPGLTQNGEDAAVGLATEVRQTGDDLKNQNLISERVPMTPSFAAAFTELGHLMVAAKSQHEAKKVLQQSDATVRFIFKTMAETIGSSQTNGLRGTVHAHWEQLKAQQKVNFISAAKTDRSGIAAKYANLLNNEISQDLVLASFATSLQELGDAHHALADGKPVDVMAAVSVVKQELQHTLDLSGRFQAISKAAN